MFLFFRENRWRSSKRKPPTDEQTLVKHRIWLLQATIVLAFAILAGQLWRLQVVEGSTYRDQADGNRVRLGTVDATRGIIHDRNGKLLVRNEPSFTVAAVPIDLPQSQQPEVLSKLSKLLKLPIGHLYQLVQERRASGHVHTPIPLKTEVDQETAFMIEERHWELPGITVLVEAKRVYLDDSLMPHTLGYTGRISAEEYDKLNEEGYTLNDRLGKMGVELTHEDELRGSLGRHRVEVDVTGRQRQVLYAEPPIPGGNLTLTLDLDLQREMTKILQESMGNSKYAAAVAMDPKNGEILGMVSLPSFNQNLLSSGQDAEGIQAILDNPNRPLLNYAIGGTFPPGSIFKLITGTAALQEGVATPSTRITSVGSISIPNKYDPSIEYNFYEWTPGGLGELDFYRAVSMSSDIYFYYLAGGFEDFKGLGPDRLASYARRYGLGQQTRIDLPGEAAGVVPDPQWKVETFDEEWVTGDSYNFAIGQGFALVTPLHMVRAVSALANGGEVLRPRVVREVRDGYGNLIRSYDKVVESRLDITQKNLQPFREGMRQGVESGTATNAQVPGVQIAGKTGTAEFGQPLDEAGRLHETHGWFIGYAPVENPQIAIVVFHQLGQGAKTAAPAGGKILSYYFSRAAQ